MWQKNNICLLVDARTSSPYAKFLCFEGTRGCGGVICVRSDSVCKMDSNKILSKSMHWRVLRFRRHAEKFSISSVGKVEVPKSYRRCCKYALY
ncbi:hypothetical protein H5410_056398 [Solanum commersonii]|uniref:Uncharacterized protein n=1 Tax=Solanum commersonii TaxID=4109 RepID=A0A9J5WMK7_SOLCO|nr:hypothetical protein H5410_056398 [Solanum commersonii]